MWSPGGRSGRVETTASTARISSATGFSQVTGEGASAASASSGGASVERCSEVVPAAGRRSRRHRGSAYPPAYDRTGPLRWWGASALRGGGSTVAARQGDAVVDFVILDHEPADLVGLGQRLAAGMGDPLAGGGLVATPGHPPPPHGPRSPGPLPSPPRPRIAASLAQFHDLFYGLDRPFRDGLHESGCSLPVEELRLRDRRNSRFEAAIGQCRPWKNRVGWSQNGFSRSGGRLSRSLRSFSRSGKAVPGPRNRLTRLRGGLPDVVRGLPGLPRGLPEVSEQHLHSWQSAAAGPIRLLRTSGGLLSA